MAPELYLKRGYGQQVDVYSLGIVLYRFMNGGKLPFISPGSGSQGNSYAQHEEAIMKRLRGEKPPRPEYASPEFADIILKAIEYNPADRYLSSAQMQADLKQFEMRRSFTGSSGRPSAMHGKEWNITGNRSQGRFESSRSSGSRSQNNRSQNNRSVSSHSQTGRSLNSSNVFYDERNRSGKSGSAGRNEVGYGRGKRRADPGLIVLICLVVIGFGGAGVLGWLYIRDRSSRQDPGASAGSGITATAQNPEGTQENRAEAEAKTEAKTEAKAEAKTEAKTETKTGEEARTGTQAQKTASSAESAEPAESTSASSVRSPGWAWNVPDVTKLVKKQLSGNPPYPVADDRKQEWDKQHAAMRSAENVNSLIRYDAGSGTYSVWAIYEQKLWGIPAALPVYEEIGSFTEDEIGSEQVSTPGIYTDYVMTSAEYQSVEDQFHTDRDNALENSTKLRRYVEYMEGNREPEQARVSIGSLAVRDYPSSTAPVVELIGTNQYVNVIYYLDKTWALIENDENVAFAAVGSVVGR